MCKCGGIGKVIFFFFKQETAYEMLRSLVGSEMCIRDRLAAGVPVRTVSGRLGHANAATTLNVYAHFLQASDRQAADVIEGLLAAPPATT